MNARMAVATFALRLLRTWRTHSCVPRRHSCRREMRLAKTRVEMSLDPARKSACATTMVLATSALFGQGLPVTYERLLKAAGEPGNWLMYSNSYDSWRYSRLTQIDSKNVSRLQVKWLYQGRFQEKFETTPLVVDGIMYLTRPENEIIALDAVTGRVLWTYGHRNPPRTFNCCGKVNRGLAILGNRLFMNTLDMHVLA